MRKQFTCASVAILALFYSSHAISFNDDTQSEAVKKLIVRLIGEQKAAFFIVSVQGNAEKYDTFTLKGNNTIVSIHGNTGVAAAYGFHYYLKYYCRCHISWYTNLINLPSILPDVNITLTSLDRYRYYQNVCTFSYSFVWFKWEQWERHIDWMALNGINLALAFTSQEAIWRNVYLKLNLTQTEIDAHFAGAGFLAWSRMGNIRGWGGPLTQYWHNESVLLQHNIINRMKELGITPILPGFCGLVPRTFKRLFPNVKMTPFSPWNKFPEEFSYSFFLDPNEDLFQTVGAMFMQEMSKEFELTHFYNCDPFNEMKPSSGDLNYLKNASTAIFKVMSHSDPKATWILQGWFFANDPLFWTEIRAEYFLAGVPNERMIILDLQSETSPQYIRLKSYFGKPFIWCMLHNFGGTLGMHGSFDVLNTKVAAARKFPNNTMIGTGMTPEGIYQNYVVYDFMSEVSWRNESVNVDEWVEEYSVRRYGKEHDNLKRSWKFLKNSVYNFDASHPLFARYIITQRPRLNHVPQVWYNSSDVFLAWDLILNITEPKILSNENYKHDVVDVTRQIFQIIFDQFYKKMVLDFSRRDVVSFLKDSSELLDVLHDMEFILSTNNRFMLGSWLHDAKLKSGSVSEETLFQFNAKNQITLWGPGGEILDYATKQWSGVVQDYYYPRWHLFIKYLYADLTEGLRFHQTVFDKDVFSIVEIQFPYSTKMYPVVPHRSSVHVARILHFKWTARFRF